MEPQTEPDYLVVITVEVIQAIKEALETLINKKGFELPIYMAAIGSNGYTYAVKYQRQAAGNALEAKELAEHAADQGGPRFPINMLFVDCRGNGARVLVNSPTSENASLH